MSPTEAPTSACSISATSRPVPSSTTVSDWPSPFASARSTTSVSPSCAGRSSAGASSAIEPRSASSSAWTSCSGISASCLGTSSVVQSTISGVGCTSTVALNVHGSASEAGSSKSYCGRRDRPQPRARGRVPEPAADVGLDRLRPEPVLAHVREQHLARHLPLAEPRDPDRAGEIGRGVLDGVLELVRRDVDREADAVPAELFDLRHSVIQAEGVRHAFGVQHLEGHDAGDATGVRLQSDTCSSVSMRARGLEPPRAEAHRDLNPARLPVPPRPR